MIKKMLSNKLLRIVMVISFLAAATVTVQSVLSKPKSFEPGGAQYTRYNNYIIMTHSFFHLKDNKDLYQLYPDEHFDYYKYSPTFPLFMAPLAILPDSIGLFIWNLVNMVLLVLAFWQLPYRSDKTKLLIFALILIELVTAVQNSQSNGLIAGLIIWGFILLEKKRIALASLLIVSTIFIKLFGIIALSLFIFYSGKWKAALYSAGWTLLLLVLPLIVVSPSQLIFLYESWFDLLRNDHSASVGLSVAGWLYTWFGLNIKNAVVLAGAAIFCLPFLKYKYFSDIRFRLYFLSSVLIWMVIFNHKAESPTFIIAVSGIAIWFFSQKIKTENLILVIIALLFTVLSPTDIFPKSIRQNYVVPYVLKAVPCILIWCKIIADMMLFKPVKNTESEAYLLS